jgi:hypothetical protein
MFVEYSSFPWLIVAPFNPLNSELNPICHPLALLGAHHILHISRIRVNFSQDRSNWSPTFTNATFQNFPGISDVLSEATFQV